ncbi:prepilin peptidase [Xanthobacter sp. AM11]|uniref:A24 family peptidase n=1 Tax=Xanthobacter sp. AM11 TaxID=3380643 RepID=UPI0039BFBF36
MQVSEVILLGLYPTALCAAIGSDLARRIIPNLVVLILLAGFAALLFLMPLPDLSLRLLVAGAVTALGFSLFAENLIGAGDAKLAGAVMLWVDPLQVPAFLAASGILCGLLTLAAAAERRQMRARSAFGILAHSQSLPYGVALAGAGLLLHPFSSLLQAA